MKRRYLGNTRRKRNKKRSRPTGALPLIHIHRKGFLASFDSIVNYIALFVNQLLLNI